MVWLTRGARAAEPRRLCDGAPHGALPLRVRRRALFAELSPAGNAANSSVGEAGGAGDRHVRFGERGHVAMGAGLRPGSDGTRTLNAPVLDSTPARSVWCRCRMFSTVTASLSGLQTALAPLAAHVNAGASAWCQVTRRTLRPPSGAPPNSCSAQFSRSGPAPTSNGASGSRVRQQPSASPLPRGPVAPGLRSRHAAARKLAPPSTKVSGRAVAFLEIVPHPADHAAQHMAALDAGPNQKAAQAGHPVQMGASSRVAPARGRGT